MTMVYDLATVSLRLLRFIAESVSTCNHVHTYRDYSPIASIARMNLKLTTAAAAIMLLFCVAATPAKRRLLTHYWSRSHTAV